MGIEHHLTIREFQRTDVPFVLDSAITCLSKYRESLFKGWELPDIKTYLESLIILSLNHHNYTIFVAVNKHEENQILAYIAADSDTNHIFLQYTKYIARNLGIQKNVLMPLVIDPTKQITVSWQTKQMLKLKDQGKVKIVNNFPQDIVKQIYKKENV
jgi:hypothetical protein